MKILIVNDYRTSIGGVETYLKSLFPLLSSRGHDVQVFYVEDYVEAFSSSLFKKLNNKLFINSELKKRFLDILASFEPDIIHLHNIQTYSTTILKLANRANAPVLQTIHDLYQFNEVDNDNSFVVRQLKKVVHQHLRKLQKQSVDTFICHSEFIKSQISKEVKRDRIKVVPLMFQGETTDNLLPFEERNNELLFVGRLEKEKGILFLIQAFLNSDVEEDFKLIIAGTGKLSAKIERIASKHDNIMYLGYVESIEKYYKRCKILVVPSMWEEPFGIVGLEGFSYGIAIVASDVGGIPEWCIDDETGLLFTAGNESELLRAIKQCIHYPKQTQARIENGKTLLEQKFSGYNHLQKMILIYRETISLSS